MRQFPMFDLGTDTEGLGRTEEEVVFDPEEEKIKAANKYSNVATHLYIFTNSPFS